MSDVVAPAAIELSTAPTLEAMKASLLESPTESVEAELATPAPVDLGEDSENEEAAEAQAEDGKAPVEAKGDNKPTRFQRIRARAEQAEKQAAHAENERVQALTLGHQWKAEAVALRKELSRIAQETGYQYDPRDLELYKNQRDRENRQIEESSQKHLTQKQAEAQRATQQNQMVDQFYTESTGLSKQFGGKLSHTEILKAYAFSIEAGDNFTMAQVAQTLAQARGIARSNAQARQVETNRAAPSPIRAGKTSPAPIRGHSVASMKAHLLSQG